MDPDPFGGTPLRGAPFETFVCRELLIRKYLGLLNAEIFFWRDHAGREVDFVLDNAGNKEALEVESGATFHPNLGSGLSDFQAVAGERVKKLTLVYGGDDLFPYDGINVVPRMDLVFLE